MARRLHILTFLIIVLTVSQAIAAPRSKQPQGSEDPAAVPSGPIAVLQDIQEGWSSGDADLILRHFGSNKVTIVLDGSGPGGAYSKDQGYYVFKELFKSTITKKFVFVQIRNSNEGAAAFAVAERRYQRRDDGHQIKDKVYVSLHVERGGNSGRWVVDEIKSIR